jgi:hypothetical protein
MTDDDYFEDERKRYQPQDSRALELAQEAADIAKEALAIAKENLRLLQKYLSQKGNNQ